MFGKQHIQLVTGKGGGRHASFTNVYALASGTASPATRSTEKFPRSDDWPVTSDFQKIQIMSLFTKEDRRVSSIEMDD